MADALGMMHTRGYRPRIVIDCGANQGQWMEVVDAVFPGTTYHAIEPQPRCATILRARMADRPDLVVHETAVSSRGVAVVRMIAVPSSFVVAVSTPPETSRMVSPPDFAGTPRSAA